MDVPGKSDAHWVANHVRVAQDVVESAIIVSLGLLLYARGRVALVYIQSVPFVRHDIEKKPLFIRASKNQRDRKFSALQETYSHLPDSPAIRALMNFSSFFFKKISFSLTSESNISSDPCSCCQVQSFLDLHEPQYPENNNRTHIACGMKWPSQTWDHGPCPRS